MEEVRYPDVPQGLILGPVPFIRYVLYVSFYLVVIITLGCILIRDYESYCTF